MKHLQPLNSLKFQISHRKLTILSGALAILILIGLGWYPYISRAGDTFSCWYNYVGTWKSAGLAAALQGADAPGRYPGYPFLLMLGQVLFKLNFLDAVRLVRLAALAGTFLGAIYFFSAAKLRLDWCLGYAFGILIIPTVWTNIAMNCQDSLKCLFFFLAAGLIIKNSTAELNNRKRIFNFLLFWICSCFLASVRAPEVFPLWAFSFVYLGTTGPPLLWRKILKLTGLILPSLLFLLWIHIYGKIAVGHFGVSGPATPPDLWLKMFVENQRVSHVTGVFENIWDFILYASIEFFNKASYVVEDYFFSSGAIHILDYWSFTTDLQYVSAFRIFILYPIALTSVTFILYLIARKCSQSVTRATLFAALISGFFYTYGLNHYEPRYWLLCVVLTFAGIGIEFNGFRSFKIGLSAIIFSFAIPFSYFLFLENFAIHLQTMNLAEIWMRDAEEACKNRIEYILVPEADLDFTSYRFFATRVCPSVKIYTLKDSGPLIFHPDHVKKFGSEYFRGAQIIGLEEDKIVF